MGFLESLQAWVLKQITCTERLGTCIDDMQMLREEILSEEAKVETQVKVIEDLTGQMGSLKAELEKIKVPDPLKEAEDMWNAKYPIASISYAGRYFPFDKLKKIEIDVRLFITPNDFVIYQDLKNNQLLVSTPTQCNDMIMKIYKHTRTKSLNPYRYEYDEPNLGVSEFWFFPHELRVAQKGDCDDWGNELASYLIAAGVPEFRVRCVAGVTYNGFGHLTVYVLGDDLVTWYHLNSTNPISMIRTNDLTQMPKHGDENDKIGIKDVWFSFNHVNAWHVFKTDTAAESFEKDRQGFLKYIKIQ